jgi:DNA invertase Pin-like site-specific DNA recombinase
LQSHAPASSSSRRRPRRVTRFVVYLRVSTLRQGASGLGIEAQREAVARHERWRVRESFAAFQRGRFGQGRRAAE